MSIVLSYILSWKSFNVIGQDEKQHTNKRILKTMILIAENGCIFPTFDLIPSLEI
jgi:hypothetical protein